MTMIYTGTTISFQNNGKFHQAHLSHPSFTKIVEACKVGSYDLAASLVDLKAVITTAFKGSLAELRDSNVYYRGEIVHSVLARRIVEIVREGFDAAPLLLFLENLMSNPSKRAVDELYGFLEVSGLPITDDGHFLAYKSVKQNFTDHHTGTMDNSVGSTVTMERNTVDEDKDRTCSNGLHFAAYEYANNFGSQGKMVVVKINPRDVVAIPSDYKNQKGRCCSYLVVEEVERSDAKLVGKSFVDTGIIRTQVTKATLADLYPPKALQVGDTVTLNAKGVKKWGNQSDGRKGVIISTDAAPFDFFVDWENRTSCYYKAKHLDLHVEPKVTVVDMISDVPEEPKIIPSDSVEIGKSYMFSGRIFNESLPNPFLGTIISSKASSFILSTEIGNQTYNSHGDYKVTVTLVPEEPKVVPVLPTYIPQEGNYEDKSIWCEVLGFKGKNNQFPVDRDTSYTLYRMVDNKEYEGSFHFTNYDVKHDNLVFIRTDTDDFKCKYVTITDSSKWFIKIA
jgi:hypothetical protein